MRALAAALALLAVPALAALPEVADGTGDGVPDTVRWSEAAGACAVSACAEAAATVEALPGEEGLAQPTRHDGALDAGAGPCEAACATAQAASSYDQPQGARPDLTLHGIPDGGVAGALGARAASGWVRAPFLARDADRNNDTRAAGGVEHQAGPLAGEAGAASGVLVLLHHDRGLPHTRLAYAAPRARECAAVADGACAGIALSHTYLHHDGDDDVVHERHRAAARDEAFASAAGARVPAEAAYDGGVLLEDSFFVNEPPSGASGDASAEAAAAQGPPASASLAFAVRDPDRDLDLDEAWATAEVCRDGACARLP